MGSCAAVRRGTTPTREGGCGGWRRGRQRVGGKPGSAEAVVGVVGVGQRAMP